MFPVLRSWSVRRTFVLLQYSDDSEFFIRKSDFDRCFGAIVSASKDDVKRDFLCFPV